MEFLIDLKSDVSKYITANFGDYARKDGTVARRETHLEYYTTWEKQISIIPRNIITSDIFKCPPELQKSWETLKEAIRSGNDLNPYRSNDAPTQKPDQLLYEWNIFHLHFLVGKRSRASSSDKLLFCTFDDTTCYAIQIGSHGSFHADKLFAAIVRNWPHLVQEVPGINDKEITEQIRAVLRKKHINSYTTINGKNYTPGKLSGFMSSGRPLNAQMHSIHDIRALVSIQTYSFEIEKDIIQFLRNLFVEGPLPLLVIATMQIVLDGGRMKFFLDLVMRYEQRTETARLPYQIHYGDSAIGL